MKPKGEIKKVLVQNDMNDPNAPPPVPSTDGRVTLSKLKAHFSRSKGSEKEPEMEGVSNPVYMEDRNRSAIMEGESSIEQPAGFDA